MKTWLGAKERSPKEAGLGGSTPFPATLIPKDLAAESEIFHPRSPPTILTELAP